MTWIELKYTTTASQADALSEALTELGALAVTTQDAGDQPLYEPDPETTPTWDQIIITGLFEAKQNIESTLSAIQSEFPDLQPTCSQLAEADWQNSWMQDFQPMNFGKRLSVIPSYEKRELSSHQIIFDPGMAFGTGKHPTTALCLNWLDSHITDQKVLIDYGCGSGILGIAALKLGVQTVYAVDHDPQAIIATHQNGQKNGFSTQQLITLEPTELEPNMADIIMANILANPLIELAQQFHTWLAPKGSVILSGILEGQANDVIQAYETYFKILKVEQLEEWVRIDGVKLI
jgi:ribosomal protein L11 methyltransferase